MRAYKIRSTLVEKRVRAVEQFKVLDGGEFATVTREELKQELQAMEVRMDAKYSTPTWVTAAALAWGAAMTAVLLMLMIRSNPPRRGPWLEWRAQKTCVGCVVIPPPDNPQLLQRLEQGLAPTCDGLKTTDMAWLMATLPAGGGIDGNGDEVACQ